MGSDRFHSMADDLGEEVAKLRAEVERLKGQVNYSNAATQFKHERDEARRELAAYKANNHFEDGEFNAKAIEDDR